VYHIFSAAYDMEFLLTFTYVSFRVDAYHKSRNGM